MEKDMSEEQISIIDTARKMETRKQAIFKVLKRLGIVATKQRHSGHGNQKIAYITMEEFNRVTDHVRSGQNSNSKVNTDEINLMNDGLFYLIQLEPTIDPGRFKVGFSSSMPERLRQLKCSAPLAELVNTWPCRPLWEKTAIDCVSGDCERLHTEVFRIDDIEKIREKCNQFFALMPKSRK